MKKLRKAILQLSQKTAFQERRKTEDEETEVARNESCQQASKGQQQEERSKCIKKQQPFDYNELCDEAPDVHANEEDNQNLTGSEECPTYGLCHQEDSYCTNW